MTDLTVAQQIDQLNQAKQLVLQDASFYPQIIRGILPIAQKPEPRLRSWCAKFLADGFASAEVNAGERQTLAVACLHTIDILFEETDLRVVKNLIECSASIYPLIFKHMYVYIYYNLMSFTTA
jgi:symplekin